MMRSKPQNENSSFRDPAGFIFYRDGTVYRQLNQIYSANYKKLISSGLYDLLVKKGLLISHRESPNNLSPDGKAFQIIKPDMIPFVSYPYEWGFLQLQQAGLTTLKIEKLALEHDMNLKDASAYNIQFVGKNPVFIDTLSFETYKTGSPWVAYRQYCQHFLAPLALMAYNDLRLNQLARPFLDGVPLDLACRILPVSARLNLGLSIHIYWQAKLKADLQAKEGSKTSQIKMDKNALMRLLDNLEETTANLKPRDSSTRWEKYYTFTNYRPTSFEAKKQLVAKMIKRVAPKTVWDLGANDGEFSRLAAQAGAYTISFDFDPKAVENNFAKLSGDNTNLILPLVMDLTNPSPNLGWAGQERMSLAKRGGADLIMALALIHHLCLSNNLPLGHVAKFLAQLGKYLIIEFVPKNDSQVVEMLSSREDIFSEYTETNFLSAFGQYFKLLETKLIPGTVRKLYLFKVDHA